MGTGRSERTVIQKCDGLFLCLQRKWGIALKKVCCQIAKNSAHKHGKGDMEEWSGRVVSTWKIGK